MMAAMELVAPPCSTVSRLASIASTGPRMIVRKAIARPCGMIPGRFVASRLAPVAPALSSSSRRSSSRLKASASSSNEAAFSFEEVLEKSELPLLVDFYATWCGPCQLMVPILAEVEKKLQGEIKVMKIDTEKHPAVASKYEIEALPTFILFKDGQPIDRVYGALPAAKLESRIRDALDSCKAGV